MIEGLAKHVSHCVGPYWTVEPRFYVRGHRVGLAARFATALATTPLHKPARFPVISAQSQYGTAPSGIRRHRSRRTFSPQVEGSSPSEPTNSAFHRLGRPVRFLQVTEEYREKHR